MAKIKTKRERVKFASDNVAGACPEVLDAILKAQPKVNVKSYQQTQITIAMPKSRYDNMGRPQVGNVIDVNLKKI